MSWLKKTCPPTSTCPHTNRTQLTTILLYVLLVLLGVAAVSSEETNEELKAQSSERRCLVDEPVPERKFLTHNSKKKDITLLGSQRIASR